MARPRRDVRQLPVPVAAVVGGIVGGLVGNVPGAIAGAIIGYEAGYYAGAGVDAATGGAVSGWARGNVSDTALGVAYHGVGIALALTGIGAVSRAIGGSGARAATRAAARQASGLTDDGLKGAAGVVDDVVQGIGYTKFRDLKHTIPGKHRHHLIEQRLAPKLGVDPGDIPAVYVDINEHYRITKAWSKQIATDRWPSMGPTTSTATIEDIVNASASVYGPNSTYHKIVMQYLRDIGQWP